MWSALTGVLNSSSRLVTVRPSAFIVLTCSGHMSINVTSWPARVSSPPTTPPIAPTPRIPIRGPNLHISPTVFIAGSQIYSRGTRPTTQPGRKRIRFWLRSFAEPRKLDSLSDVRDRYHHFVGLPASRSLRFSVDYSSSWHICADHNHVCSRMPLRRTFGRFHNRCLNDYTRRIC